jgi:hypothetical protein
MGANFDVGARDTIGGVPVTNITVVSGNEIKATTAQHGAGVADVVVTEGTRSASLPGAFTFVAPAQVVNTPPVIQSIVAQGTRTNEPAQFADLNEEITVTATVADQETAPDLLDYQWTTDVGTLTGSLSGTGKTVKWQAPSSATPATITLTVVEKYQSTDANGLPATLENRVTGTTLISVHDSVKEVGDMATLFLVNFSKSEVAVETVMKDFAPTCKGTADELIDVQNNRKDFVITAWDVQPPQVSVNFQAGCATIHGVRPGDACSNSQVRWDSTETGTGTKDSVAGVDQIAAVYVTDRWWLCSSDFDGQHASGARFLGWVRQ